MKRAILPLLIGLWGGATMLAMSGLNGRIPDLTLFASIGAAFAGLLTAPLFAKEHRLWAFIAPVLATTLGASLAGAYVGWPGDIPLGLAFGPVMVWAHIAQNPLILLLWLAGAIAVRRTACYLRNPPIP